ncbi:Mitochondrial outer membrane porin of 34 kDa [Gossypium arboreum]|uniref:Mitochondrial outer membrane porin of 34 kDa n=1 Tax=Gossypium arboreum TaxID=29729 RepID=A0A0B0NKW9_GOSAR|nr:Mitochondrial outer membrane porin of 34 kDa [Gossypium arboreum]
MKKCDLFLADVNTQLKSRNVTTDIKVDTISNVNSTSVLHEYVGISSSIGLTANPIVNFSGVLGTNVLALRIDTSFDTKIGNFTKCNAGLSFTNVDLIACLALHVNEKGDSVNASYYHIVNPSTNIVVGVEVTHSFSTNVNTITVGTQHALDPLTTIKAQANNAGKASVLIQHEWHPKSLFTISGEVDTESIDKSPNVGLALALKP